MFKIGDKVIDKNTGDVGTITRQVSKGDCWQDDYHSVWYVLWETGNLAGRELYLHERAMAVVMTDERRCDNALRAKVDELEFKVESLEKELEIANRFYEVVKKERDYYINLCSNKKDSSSGYTGLAGY